MKTYHLVYHEQRWTLKAESNSGIDAPDKSGIDFKHGTTKKWAVSVSVAYCRDKFKETGQPVSLRIHKRNGQIESERTYPRSADPHGSKG